MSDGEGYVVSVKPSARKTNAAIGTWISQRGPVRRFASKRDARQWARDCSEADSPVWIQDAVPWDGTDADGYLVGRTRPIVVSKSPGTQSQLETE